MAPQEKYANVFNDLSLQIIDTSVFYWGLYKDLQTCIRKFDRMYPFNRYRKLLFQEHKSFFEMLISFGTLIRKIESHTVPADWEPLKRYLDFFQFFSFRNRKLLKSFLEELKLMNNFMCNEWYRAHLIDLGEKNVQTCEDVYFLSVELLMLLESLTEKDL